jgi:ribosomal-protein-alanine N-acetyltransferase
VFTFQPMDEAGARAILVWRYEPPYDIYNASVEQAEAFVRTLLDPANAYQAIADEEGELVGYCCFGPDARVPGGDYGADALDVGLGVRPDLTGQGRGHDFFAAIVDFARRTFEPRALRVTVAAFNRRAIRVYEEAGFERKQGFQRSGDGTEFVILATRANEMGQAAEGFES